MTNQEVFDYAMQHNTIIDDWICDINPETGEVESNGGIESLIRIKENNAHYAVVHTSDLSTVYRPDSDAVQWSDEELREFFGIDESSKRQMDLAEADEISLIDDAERDDAEDDTNNDGYPFK